MPRGGKRDGAGRKAGSVTKKAREVANRAVEEGLTPLDYLLSVMRNPANEPAMRADAAKAAARYIHPPMAAIEPMKKAEDHAPLGERIKLALKRDAIVASAGKVVELKKPNGHANGHG